MKIINIFELSLVVILGILCNGDLTNQFQWPSIGNRREPYSGFYLESLALHGFGDYDLRIGWDRRRREANGSDLNVGKRVALEEDSLKSNGSSEEARAAAHAALVRNFSRAWPVERWRAGGYFNDDFLELINEHWLRFPPPPDWLQKTLGGVYLLFSCVGCWGNVIVLFMYFRGTARQCPAKSSKYCNGSSNLFSKQLGLF